MTPATATVGVAPRVRLATCELCARPSEALRTSVTVRHARGGAVQFAACDGCAAAMRRIIAVVGSTAAPGAAARMQLDLDVQPTTESVDFSTADLVGEPEIIYQFPELFVGNDTQSYVVRVWGQARSDGTWIGWLSFVTPDSQVTRRTSRETSQSSREHLAYWATGLEPSYLEGAFGRAETVVIPAT